ncbi:MAG: AbrB/MazE/SpoVT family DNA-binding domain-containing protein [Candidatus Micrarchaeaceae archaeon]
MSEGVYISIVYKKGNELAVNLPYEVIKVLNLNEGEEVDFFKYSDKYFIFAKKSDVLDILLKNKATQNASTFPKNTSNEAIKKEINISAKELSVLKKLDTLRYKERTQSNVKKILSQEDNVILQELIKKGLVILFTKAESSDYRYSIPPDVYNQFLFGKREKPAIATSKGENSVPATFTEVKLKETNKYTEALERKGYLVIQTESEAALLSTMLEESIRSGLVIGTRAFNKKFYVVLKEFMIENSSKVLNLINNKPMKIEDIAKAINMEEDAVRSILYILAESGDATEIKKDLFKSA